MTVLLTILILIAVWQGEKQKSDYFKLKRSQFAFSTEIINNGKIASRKTSLASTGSQIKSKTVLNKTAFAYNAKSV